MCDEKAWSVKASGLFVCGGPESFDRFIIAEMRLLYDCAVKNYRLGCFALQVVVFMASFTEYLRFGEIVKCNNEAVAFLRSLRRRSNC